MKKVDAKEAAQLLLAQDNIVIFAHRKPDGDAIGSCFGLYYALRALGKRVRVECADPLLVGRYATIFGAYEPEEFAPDFLVTADVADLGLLAGVHEKYGRPINLCIDHHPTNNFYAEYTLLAMTGAAAELVYLVIAAMGVVPDKTIANAIFTGLTTDTGCFRFPNATAQTHRIAAEMLDYGAESALINRLMFLTNTRGRLAVEKTLMDTITYHFDDRCAMAFLPGDILERFQVREEELEGISGLVNTIEGVYAGVTIRERADGTYRVSLRTKDPVNASRICAALGGGGHKNAAGCVLAADMGIDKAKETLLTVVEHEINEAFDS